MINHSHMLHVWNTNSGPKNHPHVGTYTIHGAYGTSISGVIPIFHQLKSPLFAEEIAAPRPPTAWWSSG